MDSTETTAIVAETSPELLPMVTATPPASRNRIARLFSQLGPGLIAGAADDDPSGIATYASAGAVAGTGQLWVALVTWPLMAAIQMTCARIGIVTGKGLAGAFHDKFPRALIIAATLGFLSANTFNIAADLAGMADAAEMLSGINSHYFVVLFGLIVTGAPVLFRYHQIATVLKWLAFSLVAYIVTGLIIGADWRAVARATFTPSLPTTHKDWAMLVAVLGTTISPYVFFWQASQQVEEESAARRQLTLRQSILPRGFVMRRFDIGVGTFFSNLVMYFIMLTTALTLHRNGITNIETSSEAAEALRPLAGDLAALLFTLGIIGVGFLAIPTLSGSAAYAVAETFGWRVGLNARFTSARAFYSIIIFSTLIGIAIDFANISAIKTLLWSAVLNGLLAPFLLAGILLVAVDRKLMRNQPASLVATTLVAITMLLMIAAAVGMFLL